MEKFRVRLWSVITLKPIVKTLYSIHALTGNQCTDRKISWTWSSLFCFVDKSCSCILNLLQYVDKALGTEAGRLWQ